MSPSVAVVVADPSESPGKESGNSGHDREAILKENSLGKVCFLYKNPGG